MSALTPEQRARHHALALVLRPAITEVRELADGYAARFETTPERVRELAEFITLERLCCPWLTLAVEIEREGGPSWLKVTAREGGKPFIRSEFGF